MKNWNHIKILLKCFGKEYVQQIRSNSVNYNRVAKDIYFIRHGRAMQNDAASKLSTEEGN